MTSIALKELAQKYTILYAEDDSGLRENTSELLGYLFEKVIIAEDGADALLKYNDHYNSTAKHVDIVISDINMPNMDGIDLSREITRVNKNQKIIIVSAHNDTDYFIDLINIGVSGFIQKPLIYTQISEIVYEVCLELDSEREVLRYIQLNETFKWDCELKILRKNLEHVNLTSNETLIFDLFISRRDWIFSDSEIFYHINNDDKEFSSNAVKSLVKRLRKKIPSKIIKTHKDMGYSLRL